AAVGHEERAAQLVRIDEVAVVAEDDAERRIHVERLRFGRRRRGARGGIAAMRDAHVAHEVAHVARAEDIAHQALALVHVEAVALGRDDAGCVLAAVLEHRQAVIEQLVHGGAGNDAHDSAHRSGFLCHGSGTTWPSREAAFMDASAFSAASLVGYGPARSRFKSPRRSTKYAIRAAESFSRAWFSLSSS